MLVIKKAHVAFVLVQAFSPAYLFEQNLTPISNQNICFGVSSIIEPIEQNRT